MTNIVSAVLALDSTAEISTFSYNLDDIIWHDGNPNGITAQQITEKQAELVIQADTDAAAEVANKASAKSKLAALGLSEDEISAAFGI